MCTIYLASLIFPVQPSSFLRVAFFIHFHFLEYINLHSLHIFLPFSLLHPYLPMLVADCDTFFSLTSSVQNPSHIICCLIYCSYQIPSLYSPLSVPSAGCSDRHPKCFQWAMLGECIKNRGYMHVHCAESCHQCVVQGRKALLTVV